MSRMSCKLQLRTIIKTRAPLDKLAKIEQLGKFMLETAPMQGRKEAYYNGVQVFKKGCADFLPVTTRKRLNPAAQQPPSQLLSRSAAQSC
mmetsp:Transcript_40193/g.60732  ORF Transcript_40193/g.60732 Transcript_40193/m.60732 type:complete len:90 (+) Transcript_40193:208-477(+)